MKTKKHVHRWKIRSRSNMEVGLYCSCGARRSRPLTEKEKARFDKYWKDFDARCKLQNKVAHEFERRFMDKGDDEAGYPRWKWTGYELMRRIEEWAKKYPKDVLICGIDDAHFASSDIVFVLHRIKRRLWGTSCYVITQCDGVPPKEFFMYPGHRAGIQEALAEMAKYHPTRD